MPRPRMQNTAEYNAIHEPFRFDGSVAPDTRPAAIPVGYSLSPRARAKRGKGRYVANMPCTQKTPCGEPCSMNGALRHSYHSCEDSQCEMCHAPTRFGRQAR